MDTGWEVNNAMWSCSMWLLGASLKEENDITFAFVQATQH